LRSVHDLEKWSRYLTSLVVSRMLETLPPWLDIGDQKSSRPPAISQYDKDWLNLLMWVYVIFPIMLNDIFKSFNPIEEDGLQLF
jgi:hypothetical protein